MAASTTDRVRHPGWWVVLAVVLGGVSLAIWAAAVGDRPPLATRYAETCRYLQGVPQKIGSAQSLVDAPNPAWTEKQITAGAVYQFLVQLRDVPPNVRPAFSDFYAYADARSRHGTPDHHVTREQARVAARRIDRWVATCSPRPPGTR
ncbi:MAG: hypothetical protein JWR88_1977 [Pseudonocardia sp.]|nr:hypothetical protein [Pseudonocardia sp.]